MGQMAYRKLEGCGGALHGFMTDRERDLEVGVGTGDLHMKLAV